MVIIHIYRIYVPGWFGNCPDKKTVCVYGHIDVQPAKLDDGWDTDPWKLIEKDGKLYGRGSTDDKGPVLAWLNVVWSIYPENLKNWLIFHNLGAPFGVGLTS